MEKIEFKGKEFKGTKGNFEISPSIPNSFEIINDESLPTRACEIPYNDDEGKSNARLFANSKNLLKAAIEAHKIISGMASLCQSQYDYDALQQDLTNLETEILKSL